MTTAATRIIVATHGDLAWALLSTVELIAGPQAEVHCMALHPGGDIGAYTAHIAALAENKHPCLILADMAGGTPWNVGLALAARAEWVRVVSGVNLPMLLETALARHGMGVDALALLAQETGVHSVRIGGLPG